jgi:CPA2 family monovalent cation:H+ antiporter-2
MSAVHLPPLITDLGIILAAAASVTLLFRYIKQPVVLGYIVAGILVGPEVSLLPTVQERDAIKVWAEIGVLVLLFGLGLEFSFRKLLAVGRGASVTAFTEVIFMFGLGYLIGQAFSWTVMDSLFLGGILSISSTTIIIRAVDELGQKTRGYVQLVFGILVVEDLVAILLLVLLSTIAVTRAFNGWPLLVSAGQLVFFFSLLVVAGLFFVPQLLRRVRPLLNAESTLILGLALCFGTALLATKSGFSAALGAFLMGTLLAETPERERMEHLLEPVRNLFAAIFFVSVGMLVDLSVLRDHWLAVGVITAVTIGGKVISTTLGALLGGQRLKHSVQAGMSLAQIGEFSFIIATLGVTLGVVSDFLYPIAVAVSVITTFTTPYLIRSSDQAVLGLKRLLPPTLFLRLDSVPEPDARHIRGSQDDVSSSTEFLSLLFNSVLIIAIGLSAERFLTPFLASALAAPAAAAGSLVFALLVSVPFFWGLVGRSLLAHGAQPDMGRAFVELIVRSLWSVGLLAFLVGRLASGPLSLAVAVFLSALIGAIGFQQFGRIYHWLEQRFIQNLAPAPEPRAAHSRPRLAPWDAHLQELEISVDSALVGKSLLEAGLREKYGVNLALIERGTKRIVAPPRETILMPMDRIFAVGTDDQLARLAQALEPLPMTPDMAVERPDLGLFDQVLEADSRWIEQSIRGSGFRETTGHLIVGVERDTQRILNPESEFVLKAGDRLWLVGDPSNGA